MTKKFKQGMLVVKIPLEDQGQALAMKITRADKDFAYGKDGNKYHQSNGRCAGRKIFNKKDIIQLPPFGYSAEDEAERIRNIAIRNKEIELENLERRQTQLKNISLEEQKRSLEAFNSFKGVWTKAERFKTPLGTFRVVVLQFEGQYKNDITHCSALIWLKKQKGGYIGSAAVLIGIESELYPDILSRHFSIEMKGKTKPEVVGALFLKIKNYEKNEQKTRTPD